MEFRRKVSVRARVKAMSRFIPAVRGNLLDRQEHAGRVRLEQVTDDKGGKLLIVDSSGEIAGAGSMRIDLAPARQIAVPQNIPICLALPSRGAKARASRRECEVIFSLSITSNATDGRLEV